jgi:hypothetical protein
MQILNLSPNAPRRVIKDAVANRRQSPDVCVDEMKDIFNAKSQYLLIQMELTEE